MFELGIGENEPSSLNETGRSVADLSSKTVSATQSPFRGSQHSCPFANGWFRGMDIVQLSWSMRHRDNKGSGVFGGGLGMVLSCSCVLKFGQSFSMSLHIPRCQKSFGCMNMSFHHRSADAMRTVLGVMSPRPPSVGGLISVLILYC